jgi:hypothetical protein
MTGPRARPSHHGQSHTTNSRSRRARRHPRVVRTRSLPWATQLGCTQRASPPSTPRLVLPPRPRRTNRASRARGRSARVRVRRRIRRTLDAGSTPPACHRSTPRRATPLRIGRTQATPRHNSNHHRSLACCLRRIATCPDCSREPSRSRVVRRSRASSISGRRCFKDRDVEHRRLGALRRERTRAIACAIARRRRADGVDNGVRVPVPNSSSRPRSSTAICRSGCGSSGFRFW